MKFISERIKSSVAHAILMKSTQNRDATYFMKIIDLHETIKRTRNIVKKNLQNYREPNTNLNK